MVRQILSCDNEPGLSGTPVPRTLLQFSLSGLAVAKLTLCNTIALLGITFYKYILFY